MREIVDQFIEAMRAAGCGPANPSDIIADDVRRYIDGEGDRRRSKKILYVLKIEDGRGIGGFINYRYGEWHGWVSKNDKKYTKEEKDAWRRRMEDHRKQQDQDREAEYRSVSIEARTVWDRAELAASTHPYLKKKQIQAHSTRVKDGNLLVPMYFNGRLWGYQTITEDGDKLFLKGGRVSGCYCPIAHRDDGKDRIYICEGFATAASIRQATGAISIAAFNKGNLAPVATAMRAKYPESQIIIAADNDQWSQAAAHAQDIKNDLPEGTESYKDLPGDHPKWEIWRKKGWLENGGRDAAERAAHAVGGFSIWPDFDRTDAGKRTDFNDLHATEGIERVSERLNMVGSPLVEAKKQEADDDGDTWMDDAIMRRHKAGHYVPDPTKGHNYYLIVKKHAQLRGVFAWDEFHRCVMVVNRPPWTTIDEFDVHRLDDNDITRCDYFCQSMCGMAGSTGTTRSAIYAAARENSIHPVRDYFDKMVWDNHPRLDNWLIDYLNCDRDDADYVRAVGRTMLLATVKRIYEPGCKFDHMPILEGPQGVGKSTALRIMATFHGVEYFCDNFHLKNLESKDELLKLNGVIFVELQEMSGFNKKDRDALTAFVTTTMDEYRKPYGYENDKYKRQFILTGTYNPVNGLFTDPTGYRRFWCVEVTRKVDFDALREAREQLWAEAVHRYKSGESIVLSPELYDKAHEAGKSRRVIDEWTYDVLNSFGVCNFMEVREILKALDIPIKGASQIEARRVCSILKAEGFVRTQRRKGGVTVWGWERPEEKKVPVQTEMYDDDEEVEIPF